MANSTTRAIRLVGPSSGPQPGADAKRRLLELCDALPVTVAASPEVDALRHERGALIRGMLASGWSAGRIARTVVGTDELTVLKWLNDAPAEHAELADLTARIEQGDAETARLRAERSALARELRTLGWSYGQIAKAARAPRSSVQEWVR